MDDYTDVMGWHPGDCMCADCTADCIDWPDPDEPTD